MVGTVLVVAALGLLVALVAFVITSAGYEAPIRGSGDIRAADADARALSAGIDHLNPGNG